MRWIEVTVLDESPYAFTAEGSPHLPQLLKLQQDRVPATVIADFIAEKGIVLNLDAAPYPVIIGNAGATKDQANAVATAGIKTAVAIETAKRAIDSMDAALLAEAEAMFRDLPQFEDEVAVEHTDLIVTRGGMFSQTIMGINAVFVCTHRESMAKAVQVLQLAAESKWKAAIELAPTVPPEVAVADVAKLKSQAAAHIASTNLDAVDAAEKAMLVESEDKSVGIEAYKTALVQLKAVPAVLLGAPLKTRFEAAIKVGEKYYPDLEPDPATAALFA